MTRLHDAGLFRLLLPSSLGGAELAPAAFVRIIEAIAKIDASTAWCLCQTAGCSTVAAYLRPHVAKAIWGVPRGVLAWGPAPDARAVAVEGGYRVTGTWSFASGSRHATWLGGYATIHEADGAARRRLDGAPDGRTMLFPAASVTMIDVWDVIGLRGTASDSFSVAELFVPHEHSVARDAPGERHEPGPLYCFPTSSLYASGFAGVALGIAGSMLEAFIALARDKTPRGARQRLADSAVIQSQVAVAEGRLRAARRFLLSSLDDIWAAVEGAGSISLEERIAIRLAASSAIRDAREVVDLAYHAAGASAIFANSAFERRFRDMHTVAQQVQGRQDHFENVGKFLLGSPPDTTFL